MIWPRVVLASYGGKVQGEHATHFRGRNVLSLLLVGSSSYLYVLPHLIPTSPREKKQKKRKKCSSSQFIPIMPTSPREKEPEVFFLLLGFYMS